jgi:hypothetical protein
MTLPVVALINLDEAIFELKSTLREMAIALLNTGLFGGEHDYTAFINYDATYVMHLIILDIKAAFHEASQTDIIHRHLTSQGVVKNIADYLSIEIPKMVVDAIVANFPNITATELGCDCYYEYVPPNAIAIRFPSGMQFV